MKYKMVVMDMDDTLLRDDLTLSEKNRETIIEAQKAGVKVVLASGRPTFAMKETAKQLGMDKFGTYMISYNGAVITDLSTDEIIFEKSLSKEMAHKLYDYSKEHNMYIHTYVNEVIVTPKLNEYTDIEVNITGMPVTEIDDFYSTVKGNVIKVLMLQEPQYLKNVSEKLKEHVEGDMNMTISKPFFLEFMDKGIDKASGVERIANMLGIERESVVAIGDSYNDLGMINYAGFGVCVANAKEDVKKACDYITDSNLDDGVANFFKKFILN